MSGVGGEDVRVGSDLRMCGFAIYLFLSTNRPGERVRQQFDDRPWVVSYADRLGRGPGAVALGQAFPGAEPGLG